MALYLSFIQKIKIPDKFIYLAWNFIPPVIYFLFAYLLIPIRYIFYFDSDEGYNLIKSMLLLRGYPLYSMIWSDQPPLLTYLLAGIFKIFGLDVAIGRIFILFFSILLIWSFTQYIILISSRWHALAGLLLLLVLPSFMKLSLSIMVGLPSIALATVSLFLVTLWHRNKRNVWLLLAGAVLALSVLIKLFSGFLAPIFMVGIFIDEYLSNRKAGQPWYRLISMSLFCVSFALVITLGVIFLIKPTNVSQLVFTHTGAIEVNYYAKKAFGFGLYLKRLIPLCILAVAGSVWVIKTKRWFALYSLAWTITAFAFLSAWRPVWYHHLLLFTIPSAILACIAFKESGSTMHQSYLAHGKDGFSQWINHFRLFEWVNLFVLGLFIINWALLGKDLLTEVRLINESVQQSTSENQICFELLSQIKTYAPQTHWIVTDSPMFTFRANLPTPPNLAVISQKRLLSGALSTKETREIITNLKPEQILLSGKINANAVINYINRHYTLVFYKAPYKLFLLNETYQQLNP